METKNDNSNIKFYLGLFLEKYSSSRSFITEIDGFGSLCVSIITVGNNTFAYCRSILGLKEFEYKDNLHKDELILLLSVDNYFRFFVENWDTQINAKYNFFENVASIFTSTLGFLNSHRTIQPLNDLIQAHILANISDFKLQNIKHRFSEINYFYAEEIENFILRTFLDVNVTDNKLPDYTSILDIEVTPQEYDNLEIKDKLDEESHLKIIHELIYTELEVLIKANTFYYDKILRNKDKLEPYKYNECFKDFENFLILSKAFVRDLIKTFDTFEHKEVDHTLADIYKQANTYKQADINKKEINYKQEDATHKHEDITNRQKEINNKQEDHTQKQEDNTQKKKENKIKFLNESCDSNVKLYDCLLRNTDYFYQYKKFHEYSSIIKKMKIKNFDMDKLEDTCYTIVERISKFNPLLTRILSFSDNSSKGYSNLKTLLIKINKFELWICALRNLQYTKERTWELCIKYHLDDVKGLFIDEIKSGDIKIILLADYVLILDSRHNLIDFLNVKNLDIHENGDKSLFLITNKKINMERYYEFEFNDYNMYAIKIKCMCKIIRDRFMANVRSSKKKYVTNAQELFKSICKDDETFHIPHISQRDEDWILMKYRFIMNEVLKVNGELEFINLEDIEL